MIKYYRNSVLVHMAFLAVIFLSPWIWRYKGPVMIIDGFDYMPGGGGGGDGGGGMKKEQMGQVVPAPQQIPVPAKPAPVQQATKAEDAWKVDKAPKKPEPVKETPKPAVPVQIGEKETKEQSNVVSRGVKDTTKVGEGGFDFGGEGKGGKGPGVGIGFGPGVGGGSGGGTGFGFGSYLSIMRRRIWQEWTQSPIYDVDKICVIGLTVSRSGDVRDIKIEKSSGNSFYDTVAQRAVRNSSPLPPLPNTFPDPEQRFRIAFRLTE